MTFVEAGALLAGLTERSLKYRPGGGRKESSMKRYWLLGLFFPLVPSCLVDNSIADDNTVSSAETRVADRESDWCESICTKLASCPTSECVCDSEGNCDCVESPDAAACASDCGDWVAEFLGHGEDCAAAGERLMDCFSAASCEAISNGSACALTAEEEAFCDADDPPPSNTGLGPATCQLGSGSGSAGGAAVFACETSSQECSDGQNYAVSCTINSAGAVMCNCFLNDIRVNTFSPAEAVCPSMEDINVGCGFWLADPNAHPERLDPTVAVACNGASGGGGPAPGVSEFGCTTMRGGCEDGHSYTTRCALVDGVPTCDCEVDGQVQSSFHVPDSVCPGLTGTTEELQRINAGCGWYILL